MRAIIVCKSGYYVGTRAFIVIEFYGPSGEPKVLLCCYVSAFGLSLTKSKTGMRTAVAIHPSVILISKACFLASSGFKLSASVKKIEGTKHPNAIPKIFA